MKPTRRNPLFSGFFRKNFLTSAIVLSFGAAGLSTQATAQTLYWDVNGADTGSGNAGDFWSTEPFDNFWSTSSDGDVATQAWTDGGNAVFSAGTDGTGTWTVDVDGTIAPASITFRDNGLQTIAGGNVNITPAGGLALTSSAVANGGGNTKVISSLISGSGGLAITSHGDTSATGGGSNTLGIRLANIDNVFTGDITIASGLVGYAADSSFGNEANKIIMNGGGLIDSNLSIPLARDIEVLAGGGVIRTWGSVNTTWTGALTGTGNLRRTDGGNLGLNMDASAFQGTLTNERGTIRLESLDWAQTDVVQTDGTNVLRIETPGTTTIKSLTSDRDIIIAEGSRLDIASGNYLMNSGADANPFQVTGAVFANPGALTSSSGTLTTTSGSPGDNLTARNNFIFVVIEDFDGSTPLALVKNHNNQLQLLSPNTHTGGTVINGGRVNADNISAFGTGAVTVNAGGQAWLTQGTAIGEYTNNFTISGNGVTEAAGTLGAIRFQNSTLEGDITVASAGARITAQSGTHTGALLGSGNLEINGGGATGTINLAGDATGYTGTVVTAAGLLNTGALGGGLTTNGGTTNLSGQVAGTTTVAEGSTLNIDEDGVIGTPVLPAGAARLLNILSGGTIDGNVNTTGATATVALAGDISGNVTVAENGTLVLNGGSIGGNLTGTLNDAYQVNQPIDVSGDLSVTGTQTVLLNANVTPGSPATVLSYGGTFTGDIADFALQGSTSYRGITFVDTGSAITVDVDSGNRTWAGTDATNPTFWDAGTTVNFTGGDNRFFNGDAVVFDDSATETTVAMQGTLIPFSVTFANTTKDYTVTGPGMLSGNTGITKNGAGIATLGGAEGQNYTGPITVNAGTLRMGSRDAFGQSSGITIASGAAVDINGQAPGSIPTGGYTYTIAGTGLAGAGVITNTGGGAFSNAGIKTVILAGDASIGGVGGRFDIGFANTAGFGTIDGGGFTLTKTGPNQVVARGPASNVTYVVNEGTLTFENFDEASGTSPITVNAGTLNTFGPRILVNDVVLADGTSFGSTGGGAATWNGDLTLAGNANLLTGGNLTLNGSITGSGDLIKAAGNILFVQGDNSGFSGRILNSAGILRLIDANALGTGIGTDVLTIGNSTLEGGTPTAVTSLTLNAGQGITQTGNVTYNPGAGNTMTINGPVTGTGNIIKPNNSGGLIFNSSVGISNGFIQANGGVLQLNQAINVTGGNLRTGTDVVATISGTGGTIGDAEGTGGGIRMWRSTLNIAHSGDLNIYDFQIQEGGGQAAVINHTSGNVNATADVRIGHWGGATSVYNISGGSLNLPDTVTAPTSEAQANLFIGIDGTGNLNISGSGVVNTSSLVVNGRGGDTADTLNLTGGTLNIGRWGIRNPGTAFVNLGGGTLGAWASDWTSNTPITLTGISGDVTINTLDAVDGTTPRNITLSGSIDGSGGFIKTGTGTLALTGNNSYTGDALVEEGILVANGSLPGTLTVQENGALSPGAAAIGTSVTELTIGGQSDTTTINGQIIVDLNGADETTGSGINDLIFIPGDVDFGPNSTILPRFFGAPVSSGNVYTVMQVDGDRTGLPVIDPAIADSVRFDFTVLTGAPPFEGDILVEVTGNAGDLVWTGATNSLWNTNGDENWTLDSDPAKFLIADSVTFDDTGDSTQPIELVGTLQPGNTTVNASSDYTFTGSGFISGNGGLTKDGSGTLTLLTNNNYNGPVVIDGGHVVVGDGGTSGALGGLDAITIAEDASLTINRSDDLASNRLIQGEGTFIKRGTETYNFQGPGTVGVMPNEILVEQGTFQVSTGAFFTGSRLTSGGSITVSSGAKLLLQGSAHALGGTNLNVGGLVINLDGGTMTLNNEQYVETVNMNGALIDGTNEIRGLSGFATGINVVGTSPSTIDARVNVGIGNVTFNVDDVTGSPSTDLLINGSVTGGNILVKDGDGTLELAGDKLFSGTLRVDAGTILLSGTGDLDVNRTLAGVGVIRNGYDGDNLTLSTASAAFEGTLDTPGKDVLVANDFGGIGSVIEMSGDQTLTLGVPINVYDLGVVAINFANGAAEALDDTTAKGPLDSSVWNSSLEPTTGDLANGTIVNAVDSNGDPTPITIQWSSANTWGSGSGTDNENSKIMNGYLDDGGGGNTVNISGLSSGGYNIYGLLGSDAGASYTSRDFNVGGSFVYGGASAVSKPAFGTWAGAGEQWVQLIPSTDTPGNFWRVDGFTSPTLTVKGEGGGAGRGPLAGLIIQGDSVALEFGQSTVNSGIDVSGGDNLTIDVAGINNYDINGPITADAGQGVVKTGDRALNLNGVNTYSGTTTVEAGTLGGNGTIAGAVVVNSGAGINPGASVGTLTTGDVTFETGSSFTIEVDSSANAADGLIVNGSVSIGSGVSLDIIDIAETPGTLANNVVFTLISASGGITGTFQGLPDDTIITVNGVDLTLNYTANTVTLSSPVVPVTGFEDWALQIADANQRGRGDDPDGDGFTNLQEFLFGTSPVEPNGSLMTSERNGNVLTVRWLELVDGASYTLQESDTLANPWATSAVIPADDANQAGVPADYVRRVAEVPIGPGRNFVRIEGEED